MGCRKLTYLSAKRQKGTTENEGLKVVYCAKNLGQRFLSPDPLSEMAPDWNPNRGFFNNPFIITDPTGLFETRKEARVYRRENRDEGVRGDVKKNGDGGFMIHDKKNGISYSQEKSENTTDGAAHIGLKGDGVRVSATVTPEKSSASSNIMSGTMVAVGFMVVNDLTVVGVFDDPLIPFVAVGGAAAAGIAWLIHNSSDPISSTMPLDVLIGTSIVLKMAEEQDPLETSENEHKSNQSPSNRGTHQKGRSRVKKDRGREKGDGNRRYPRNKPKDWSGPWPPPKK